MRLDLVLAYQIGELKAAEEVKNNLREELRKRLTDPKRVGWKEQAVPPARLLQHRESSTLEGQKKE